MTHLNYLNLIIKIKTLARCRNIKDFKWITLYIIYGIPIVSLPMEGVWETDSMPNIYIHISGGLHVLEPSQRNPCCFLSIGGRANQRCSGPLGSRCFPERSRHPCPLYQPERRAMSNGTGGLLTLRYESHRHSDFFCCWHCNV